MSADAGANIGGVPTISHFYGLAITVYFDDHGRPHFHVRNSGGAAKTPIDVIEVIDSSLAIKQLRLALASAELHRQELLENWRRAQAGETLEAIDPLK